MAIRERLEDGDWDKGIEEWSADDVADTLEWGKATLGTREGLVFLARIVACAMARAEKTDAERAKQRP